MASVDAATGSGVGVDGMRGGAGANADSDKTVGVAAVVDTIGKVGAAESGAAITITAAA
jgi:hypothetical protein